jgi:hypothetical protein
VANAFENVMILATARFVTVELVYTSEHQLPKTITKPQSKPVVTLIGIQSQQPRKDLESADSPL